MLSPFDSRRRCLRAAAKTALLRCYDARLNMSCCFFADAPDAMLIFAARSAAYSAAATCATTSDKRFICAYGRHRASAPPDGVNAARLRLLPVFVAHAVSVDTSIPSSAPAQPVTRHNNGHNKGTPHNNTQRAGRWPDTATANPGICRQPALFSSPRHAVCHASFHTRFDVQPPQRALPPPLTATSAATTGMNGNIHIVDRRTVAGELQYAIYRIISRY